MRDLRRDRSEWIEDTTPPNMTLMDKILKLKYGNRGVNSIGELLEDDTQLLFVIDMLLLAYGTKWDRLYSDFIAEYNPIWNVDGTVTETETRDLLESHTGTDTIAQSGTDTTTHTGTDTTTYTGTDTTSQTGTDTVVKTGTETNDIDEGHNTTRTFSNYKENENGTVTNTFAEGVVRQEGTTRTEDTQKTSTGNNTVDTSVYGFDGVNASPSGKEVTASSVSEKIDLDIGQDVDISQDTDRSNTEARDIDKTTTGSYTDGFTANDTHKLTRNTQDQQTKNLTDTSTKDLTDRTTKNLTDSTLKDLTDLRTRNLLDSDEGTITRETTRTGNIGVTMTQQMLNADQDYWNQARAQFYESVILDTVNYLTHKIVAI